MLVLTFVVNALLLAGIPLSMAAPCQSRPPLEIICTTLTRTLRKAFRVGEPMRARQIGNLTCNIDRLQTVTGLVDASLELHRLTALASSAAYVNFIASRGECLICLFRIHRDLNTTAAALIAASGVATAEKAAVSIVTAVVQNLTAPPQLRQQLSDGLNKAASALLTVNSFVFDTLRRLQTSF